MASYSDTEVCHTCLSDMPEEFKDIAPYGEEEFHRVISRLVKEPGFEHAIKYMFPESDYKDFSHRLVTLSSQAEFQHVVMGGFLEKLAATTTDGVTCSGTENITPGTSYTFISNHRDIVLDASFLNLCFMRYNIPLTQIAIGNNLLIYEWITDLVKLNRSFIVKRDVGVSKALEAARQLSAYIHYAIGTLGESVWIAQREGRAKDSNDRTQEALIKMISLAGGCSVAENIMAVNLCPVSISYEYDPNDYLKAREFLLKYRDPEFKKSTRDDLFSMETGLLKYKGRVHFHLGKCINPSLEGMKDCSRTEVVLKACEVIDNEIHCGYKIFPGNYIAYDLINKTQQFSGKYTSEEKERFMTYISGQLAKTGFENVSKDEYGYMEDVIMRMYANPLVNMLKTK